MSVVGKLGKGHGKEGLHVRAIITGAPITPAKRRCPRDTVTWGAIGLLVLVTTFVIVCPLGQTGSQSRFANKVHHFEKTRQNILVVAVPSALSALCGAVMAHRPKLGDKSRFWIGSSAAILVSYALLQDYQYFIPLFVIHGMPLPNPAGLGIAAITGLGAMGLSHVLNRDEDGSPPSRKSVPWVAVYSIGLSIAIALIMTPYLRIEWLNPPAVLDDSYELAWQAELPARETDYTGFWFPSQVRAQPAWGSSFGGEVMGEPPVDEDALFLTSGWMGRIRLHDGTLSWGREFDFGPLENRTTALAAFWDDERLYVVNRSTAWTLFAFDWDSGLLEWKATTEEWSVPRPDDPNLTLAVTPKFLVIAGEGGKAEYILVDPKTGAITEHTLPKRGGMDVARIESWTHGFLGPYLVHGADGTIALLAQFAPQGIDVMENWYQSEHPPEKGYLFGLDPSTGEVAWQIEDMGDWRGVGPREGANLWITKDHVIRCGGYPSPVTKVWNKSTGTLLWSRSFDETSRCLATHHGVFIYHDLSVLECLDARTGDRAWSIDMKVTNDVPSISVEGDTILASTPEWVCGIEATSGSEVFRIDTPDGGRTMLSDAREGIGALNATPHSVQSYLFSVDPGVLPGSHRALGGTVPVFKAQGSLSFIMHRWESRPTRGYSGQFMEDGWVLLTSFEEKAQTYHVYMLRPD